MNRRLPFLAVALAATAVLSSCSTFDQTAAEVGDQKVSQDLLDAGLDVFEVICDPQEAPQDPTYCQDKMTPAVLESLQLSATEGPALTGDIARFWLGYLVHLAINDITLERLGGSITDADVTAAEERLAQQVAPGSLPPAIVDQVRRSFQLGAALRRVATAPTPEQIEAQYAQDPASTGVLCLSHILVDTLAEARDVEARLAAGEDFAALATEVSNDGGSATLGGALTGSQGEPCTLVSELIGAFDPAFLAGALHAKAGEPTDPVKSSFGWHIILARPLTDVRDSLIALINADPANAVIYADYVSVPVTVDSRYGRWDPAQGAVVPLR